MDAWQCLNADELELGASWEWQDHQFVSIVTVGRRFYSEATCTQARHTHALSTDIATAAGSMQAAAACARGWSTRAVSPRHARDDSALRG